METELGPQSRPSVPSDRFVGPDMFSPVPVLIGLQADMFRSVPPDFNVGYPDLFVSHPVPVPGYPLLNYPKQ